MSIKTGTLTIRMDIETRKALIAIAEKECRSQGNLIKMLIKKYVQDNKIKIK